MLRLLAKQPEPRFATAEDVHEAIEQVALRTGASLSTPALGRFVRDTFGGARPEPWIELRSRSADAAGDRDVGAGGRALGERRRGGPTVEVRAPGCAPYRDTQTAGAGGSLAFDVALPAAAPPPPRVIRACVRTSRWRYLALRRGHPAEVRRRRLPAADRRAAARRHRDLRRHRRRRAPGRVVAPGHVVVAPTADATTVGLVARGRF